MAIMNLPKVELETYNDDPMQYHILLDLRKMWISLLETVRLNLQDCCNIHVPQEMPNLPYAPVPLLVETKDMENNIDVQ